MSLTDRQNSHLYNPTRFAPIFHTKKRKRKINSFFNTKCLFFFLFLFLITIFNSHTEFKYAIYIKNLKSFSNSVSLFLSLTQNLQDFQEVNCAIFLISLSFAFLSCLVAAKTLEMINLTVFFFFLLIFLKIENLHILNRVLIKIE